MQCLIPSRLLTSYTVTELTYSTPRSKHHAEDVENAVYSPNPPNLPQTLRRPLKCTCA
jgi:hypothetical protein